MLRTRGREIEELRTKAGETAATAGKRRATGGAPRPSCDRSYSGCRSSGGSSPPPAGCSPSPARTRRWSGHGKRLPSSSWPGRSSSRLQARDAAGCDTRGGGTVRARGASLGHSDRMMDIYGTAELTVALEGVAVAAAVRHLRERVDCTAACRHTMRRARKASVYVRQ